ncbi:MAG: DUF3842 family protein [Solobacterium sp.]|nr:DUF3842 family protein [Solobacterium sp.]
MKKKRVVIIDAQGGGLGKQLISRLRKENINAELIAVGTNSAASAAMLKAGADRAATGENAVVVCARTADYIIGPVGIVIADSMLGEITPAIAKAVGQSDAMRILIPFNNCSNYMAGTDGIATGDLINDAASHLAQLLRNE